MALAVFLLILCVILWIYHYLTTLKFYEFGKKVGGPRGLPLLGVLHRLVSMRDVLYILPQWTGKGKSAFFWLVTKPTFYTYDPEKIEKILTSPNCINKSEIYDLIDIEIGSGLMSSKSPIWEKHRKLLNPCFSHKILLSFFPIFNDKSNNILQELDKLVGHGENDMWALLVNFSLETSYATTVGEQVSQTVGKDAKFIGHVKRYLNTVFDRSLNPMTRFDMTFRFNKSYKAYHESKNIVHSFVRSVLTEKLTKLEEQCQLDANANVVAQNDSIDIVKQQSILIDMVVHHLQKNVLTWQEACNEAYVVIAAAFETSATTLYTILMLMAMHPEYQERLFEEVVSIFPKENFDVDYEHLDDLVYMDMFINETLRVTPSVPLISRSVSKDVHIGDDLWIPEGTLIIMDLFNLHRCEEFWGPNAKKFNPDNFLPENQYGKHPYTYIPFSKGPRNCIGWRYARMFLKVALSKIIRSYRISTTFRYENLRCVQHLSLRYEVTPKLEIHRRISSKV